MAAQHVEVHWELDGQPVWWAAIMRQEPDGAAELDYVRRDDVPAHKRGSAAPPPRLHFYSYT